MSKAYTEEDVLNFVSQALHLNAMQPIYNVGMKNGELTYTMCKPFEHALRDLTTGEWYDVIASDDAVVVATHRVTGVNKIIYQAGLLAFDVVEKANKKFSTEGGYETAMPDIGSVFTHNNGNTYLVFGLGNLHAQEQNRDKYPVVVFYVGRNGYIWAKPVEAFLKSATLGGNFEFNEGVKMVYMGISDNDALENGFMTKELGLLMQHAAEAG